ncbi:complexin-3-like isoform X2 [Sylvia atricapilla]|uniref:complexin-3-like isoform X2 n=1 Tax=Sylvia atricapilla TaxID=48155 RepID=UPI0033979747
MASFFTAALKSFQGGKDEAPKGAPKDDKAAALPNGMAREEFEEYQRQLLEEKIERDKVFAQRKAERATVRMHLRDKYHLAQRPSLALDSPGILPCPQHTGTGCSLSPVPRGRHRVSPHPTPPPTRV